MSLNYISYLYLDTIELTMRNKRSRKQTWLRKEITLINAWMKWTCAQLRIEYIHIIVNSHIFYFSI